MNRSNALKVPRSFRLRFGTEAGFFWAQGVALLLLFCVGVAEARGRSPKIDFQPALRGSLTQVLYRTDELRQALVERKDALVITRLQSLSLALGEALRTPDPDAQNKKHLDLILQDAKKAVDRIPRLQGEERRENLQQAFRQLVLVGQTYVVDKQLKFYFCRRDRSVWFQREGKPINPISPDSLGNCAQQVQ